MWQIGKMLWQFVEHISVFCTFIGFLEPIGTFEHPGAKMTWWEILIELALRVFFFFILFLALIRTYEFLFPSYKKEPPKAVEEPVPSVVADDPPPTPEEPLVPEEPLDVPNMSLWEAFEHIAGRSPSGKMIDQEALNQIREKAAKGEIIVYGCSDWAEQHGTDYRFCQNRPIPAEHWEKYGISWTVFPFQKMGIASTPQISEHFAFCMDDKTGYGNLHLNKRQVETAWPKGK